MARLRLNLVFAVFCSIVAIGQSKEGITKPPPASTIPLEVASIPDASIPDAVLRTTSTLQPTTTHEPNTTTTLEPKTTTTEPNTTTTAEPKTTTKIPDTTTSVPDTTTPPPKTTTPATTTPAPAPTPKPGPLPPATQGTWVYSEQNKTCIVVQFAASLNVTYLTMDNTTLAHALLNVPSNATVIAGSCGNQTQWIKLAWPATTLANNLTLQFVRNDSTHLYSLKYLNASLTPDEHYVNASSDVPIELTHTAEEWSVPLTASYRCSKKTQLNMTEPDGAVATLTLARLQEQAFRTSGGSGFSDARDCGDGDVPDAVPIAVGCALGGLVVVMLVAYLVARRRSAARGYLSM